MSQHALKNLRTYLNAVLPGNIHARDAIMTMVDQIRTASAEPSPEVNVEARIDRQLRNFQKHDPSLDRELLGEAAKTNAVRAALAARADERGLPPRLTDFRLQELFDGCDFESMVTADDLFYIIARAVEKEVRAALAAQADARREDGAMLDWLDSQSRAYGFADVHEGNIWEVRGAYRTVRDCIRAEMAAMNKPNGDTK